MKYHYIHLSLLEDVDTETDLRGKLFMKKDVSSLKDIPLERIEGCVFYKCFPKFDFENVVQISPVDSLEPYKNQTFQYITFENRRLITYFNEEHFVEFKGLFFIDSKIDATFQNSNFNNSTFKNVEIVDCTFANECEFKNTLWVSSQINLMSFETHFMYNAILYFNDSKFIDSELIFKMPSESVLDKCLFQKCKFSQKERDYNVELSLENSSFEDCEFNKVYFTFANFTNASFKNFKAYDLNIDESNVIDATFRKGTFVKSSFGETNFQNTLFENVVFDNVDFENANCINTNFKGCQFIKGDFNDCMFTDETVRSHFETYGGKYIGPNQDLSDMRFQYMDLSGIDFSGCDLTRTLFFQCTFENNNFEGTKILGTQFDDVFYKSDINSIKGLGKDLLLFFRKVPEG